MDTGNEMQRLKWLLIVGVVFLISGFFSWREMQYAMFGKRADASLVRVYETQERGRRGRVREKLAIEYQFADAGSSRKETDTVSIDTARPTGETVPVQYLAGSPGKSRLVGHTQQFWVLIFLGSLGFMGYKVFRLVQESKS